MNENWLCLRTTTGKEYALAETLTAIGAESYAPRIQVEHRIFCHKSVISKPFFPSYLFTNLIAYNELQAQIKQLPVRLKSYRVGVVDDYLIESLREREQKGFIITHKKSLEFGVGECVIVNSDSFRDIEAIFLEHCADRDRIKVLMSFFGSQREVVFDSADVRITRPVYA